MATASSARAPCCALRSFADAGSPRRKKESTRAPGGKIQHVVARPDGAGKAGRAGVGPRPDANGNGQVTITTAPCGIVVTPKFTG
jgi:hypothetical protein